MDENEFRVEVISRLVRLEERLNAVLADDLDRRVTRLERWSWVVIGAALATGGLAAHVSQVLAL